MSVRDRAVDGAFAAGWAFANLFQLGEYGVHILQAVFFFIGVYVMVRFILNARRVEPFTDERLEQALERVAGRLGYAMQHEVVLRGACGACR